MHVIMKRGIVVLSLASLAWTGDPGTAHAQARPGRLLVTVVDQTGGVLPGAVVRVRPTTPDAPADATTTGVTVATNDAGIAAIPDLAEGRYDIDASFEGFDPVTLPDVRVRGGDVRRRITLRIKKVDELLTVGRDRQSAGLDPGGAAFSTVLTREQIDALPDDPDELEAALKAMAPPGSTIRVDGFTGGRLPSKSQIRSIRLPRMDMFAAQNHGGFMGAMFIDILTQPGLGPLRGSVDINFLDEALNARNAFTPTRRPEQLRRAGFNLSGTIRPNKTSFSINANGGTQYTSPNLLAVTPDGSTLTDSVRQPRDSFTVNARLDHAINKDHAIRASVDVDTATSRNLGVGGYNLFDLAYENDTTTSTFRLSENGPLGRRFFTESRFQVRRSDSTDQSAIEAPTIRVIDAFTSGGAQQRGGAASTTFEVASDLDYVRGAHSWRTGLLVEGGRHSSDDLTNYLGTYTFASLADFNAGRALSYTRRIGDPVIDYTTWRAGVYVQDDWRVTRSLLLGMGVRYGVQGHVGDGWNLSPRVTAAWSPFRHGKLTVRANYGYFYDWIADDLYKQSLLVDGDRLRSLNIIAPAYPDPGTLGDAAPTDRYEWPDALVLPSAHRMSVGFDRQVSANTRLNLSYNRNWGRNVARGRNLNTPVNGLRPDPAYANVVELASDGESRSQMLHAGINIMRMDWRRTFMALNYTWSKAEANTTGGFSLPASGDVLDTEWGPAPGDIRHRVGGSFNSSPFRNFSMGVNLRTQSGMAYNATTGRDDNGDGVFNDRPAGETRNARRGAAQVDLGGRMSYAIGFGGPRQTGGAGGTQIAISMGGGGGLSPGFGGGAEDKRYRVEFYILGQNLLNRVNYTAYSWVLTSPFFGQPIAASQPRKLQVGMRFGF